MSSNFTYDDLNRLKSLNAYQYQLGSTGNRQSATEPNGRSLSWTYDGIYRLTNETITLDPHAKNGMVGYDLDPVGNRLAQNSTLPGIPTASFTYDANDRILSTETYDNNGNTTVSGGRTFTYDFENHLKSMSGAAAVALQYDGDGNRVAKTVGGVTTRYLVDDFNPTGYAQVIEELVNGAVQRTYTYGEQRVSQNQLLNNTWVSSFYGYDGGGHVRMLTDAAGTVTDTYDYDAWGNTVNSTGSTPNTYLYRGEQNDPDLGLYYLRARYFNPLAGRFLSRDSADGVPTDPSTLHKYLYAGAGPVNGIDPSGQNTLIEYTFLIKLIGPLPQIKANFPAVHWQIPSNPNTTPPPDCKEHPSQPKGGFPNMLKLCNPGRPVPDQPWYLDEVPKGGATSGSTWDEFQEKSKKACEQAGEKRGFYSYAVCVNQGNLFAGGLAYCECCVSCLNGKPSPFPAPKPGPTPTPKPK